MSSTVNQATQTPSMINSEMYLSLWAKYSSDSKQTIKTDKMMNNKDVYPITYRERKSVNIRIV